MNASHIGPDPIIEQMASLVAKGCIDTTASTKSHGRGIAAGHLGGWRKKRRSERVERRTPPDPGAADGRALVTHGPVEMVVDAIGARRSAGADHVALRPLGDDSMDAVLDGFAGLAPG